MQPYLKEFRTAVLLSFCFSILILIVYLFNLLRPFDNSIYDSFMSMKIDHSSHNDIIIVEIDNKSIKTIGRWPWNRKYHSIALENINKAKPAATGLTILFSEPSPDDSSLFNVFKNFNHIVSPFTYDRDSVLFPLKEIKNNSICGDMTLIKDKDGIVRQAYKESVYLPGYDSFAVAVNKIFKPDFTSYIYGKKKFYINFIHKTALFKRISFIDVYKNQFNKEDLKDKIVLIGITAEALTDNFNTPLSAKIEKAIKGVELQAHIINTIVNDKLITKSSSLTIFVLLFLTIIIFIQLLKRLKPLMQPILTLIFIVSAFLISFFLFSNLLYWVTPSIFVLSYIVIYIFFAFKTLLKIDKVVNRTFTELSYDENYPLPDLSNKVEDGVLSLSQLTQLINKDRQVIKAILNAINSPVMLIDSEGNIIWKNLNVNSIQSMVLASNIKDLSININDIRKLTAPDIPYKQELYIEEKDYLLIITIPADVSTNYVCIFNDITEFKKLDRLKTDLIRTVSHEIRTPLTMIQLDCDIGKEMGDLQTAIKSFDSISAKTEELTTLVSEFLDLSKLEANMIELSFEDINICNLLQTTVDSMTELANQKEIKIMPDIDECENACVKGDSIRLKQVFINIISNAIKYSPENTSIRVLATRDESSVLVSIIDQGFGIPDDEIDKIFDRFYRVKTSETKKITGSGLGLAITKKIITMHNGKINVKSSPGKGSVFTVILPCKNYCLS